ncbi:MAG: SRPBCC family protein [Candidatus Marinimicrobia bacterium]|nr:SRPBCC family protein [Candidatus Neomarinimicrobiota bacterium]MCF7829144.1 SRPBCC family protein [Candidatus Neomarinimicrobiota bacterium]MCF7881203.1 SRPBCC family protein [Candidatus Neomarinimicrobiota bacterium]
MNSNTTTSNNQDTSEREIVLTREFDAPREQVFDAWTSPDKIGQWWGPDGFTTTTHSMDFREGGVWDFVMHGPDGTDYKNYIKYTEIVKPKWLSYEHGEEVEQGPLFHGMVIFEDLGGKTRLTFRTLFPTKEARDKNVEENGAIEGGKQTLNRLAEYLKKIS